MAEFKQLIRKIKSFEEAIALLQWDLQTGTPQKGVARRSRVIGDLYAESIRLMSSPAMSRCLDVLSVPESFDQLDVLSKKMVDLCRREQARHRKIPLERATAYAELTSQAAVVWAEAKQMSDFQILHPYLEQIVQYTKEFLHLWGTADDPYDTLLDILEPGLTVKQMDPLFSTLREHTMRLYHTVRSSPHDPPADCFNQTFDVGAQREFCQYLLHELGFDFAAGRFDESPHPFCQELNQGDVRLTTCYRSDDLRLALFGTLHEFGHALYEQNISPSLLGTNLSIGSSAGLHESQARFWENMIGRNRAFWERYFPLLQKRFASQLGHLDVDLFYKALNRCQASMIRTEADELTYQLHVLIRYDIEKELINGMIRVCDLPERWNAAYEQTLGMAPRTDREGVLQDMQWACGVFGYFPSYAIGNLYAAQFFHAIQQRYDVASLIFTGDFAPIRQFLTEHVYRHGKLKTPQEILLEATGEELNPQYLIRYLETKYTEIYRIRG